MKSKACPTPDKVARPDRQAARRGGAGAVREANALGKVCPPLWWYLCPCGALHLTSRPPSPEQLEAGESGVAADVPEHLQRWAFPTELTSGVALAA